MIGLAILGIALTVLIKSASVSMGGAKHAQMVGVVTDLTRGKMHDIEEVLLKDGFTETDQSEGECGEPIKKLQARPGGGVLEENRDAVVKELAEIEAELRDRLKRSKKFEDEGWPHIGYSYKVEQVELPSWEDLQAMAQGRAEGSGSGGSGEGSDGEGGFQNSALGGMLSQLGGGFGGGGEGQDIDSRQGASFIQGQYTMVQQVLKVSIRKVTLCVYYEVTNTPYELKTVAYFTDAAAMDKVLAGLGSKELPEEGAGSGSGSGSANPPRDNRTGAGSGSGGKR
jgi:hypothetical protein